MQDFFCQRLIGQRNVTARTVASYRDAFRLLLRYAESRLHRSPVDLGLADLAIPAKRFDRPLLGFLSAEEMQAILDAPDRSTWSGRRDHVMLTTFYNTGARVSEIVALRVADPDLGKAAAVRIRGRGRKERMTPLWRSIAKLLGDWLDRSSRDPAAPVFPNRHGRPMSRSGVEQRLQAAVTVAETHCSSLRGGNITPHTLRHTTAMHLLQSGVDLSVIALWLGHESPATTHRYLEADLAMKERALQSLQEPPSGRLRYRPTDKLLAFPEGL